MLSILGFGMVLTFMYLIMTKRLSPLVALISIPIIFALIGGFGSEVDDMILSPAVYLEMGRTDFADLAGQRVAAGIVSVGRVRRPSTNSTTHALFVDNRSHV